MKTKTITSMAVERAGKFLLLKRSMSDTYPGIWEFPSGKVRKGEKLEKCAKRELLEETGLKARELEYRGRRERVNEDVITIVNYFYTKSFAGTLKISEEHSDFGWFSKKGILGMKRLPKGAPPDTDSEGKVGTDVLHFFRLESARKS